MHVVDVVPVRDGDVPAALVVLVVVALVGAVLGGGRHDVLPVPFGRAAARRRPLPRYRFTVERRPSPRTRSGARAERGRGRVASCRSDHA
ncbi:hypothetical protein GCM10017779_19820 [Streptomyces capillispiralis]|nr:hypothetical protein GCM10017779_19820 [Streptomyces capillispiralis]